jgi:hypothetical protein
MIPQMMQRLVFMAAVMARVAVLVKGACGVLKQVISVP